MKNKIKFVSTFIITFFASALVVNAAPSATFSVNKNSVEVGQSVTATVRITDTAAWSFKIKSSGSTNGCSQSFADATSNAKDTTKSFSVTCKATAVGNITFTLSGDITGANGSNKVVSGSKTVTVVAAVPKSTDNTLRELKIEGYEISFDKNKTDYEITTKPGVTSVKIYALANHVKASIRGTGTIEVKEGDNILKVVVTAESGATKIYTIKVIVPEKAPVTITSNDKTYLVLRKIPNEKPSGFTPLTVKIGDEEVSALYNEKNDLTLVYATESEKNYYYILKEQQIVSPFVTLPYGNTMVQVIDAEITPIEGMEKVKFKVDDFAFDAYQIAENSRFYAINGTNLATSETFVYSYDSIDKTLQFFDGDSFWLWAKADTKATDDYLLIIYALGGALGLLILISLFSAVNKAKMKKMIKKFKDELATIKNKENQVEEPNIEKTKPKKKKRK